ncbi:GGDEF domain-containing protein [Rheinheimera sp. UJ51]|nr:GGDEF domain-containing protein [Rheinheimera sp. UJ51]
MIEPLTINIISIFLTLQFVIACWFFHERNHTIRGFSAFLLAGFCLLSMSILELILNRHAPQANVFINNTLYATALFWFCRAFSELLEIRSNKNHERFCLIGSFVPSLLLAFFHDANADVVHYWHFTIGVMPLVYLTYIVAKKARYTQYQEELSYFFYTLQLIILCHLVFISMVLLSFAIPESTVLQIQTVSSMTMLFGHLTLIMVFLMLAFRLKHNQMKKLGETDYLTSILNRRAFFERLESIPKRDDLYFILIDADFFKKINDDFGHDVGDEALKHIANQISSLLSKADLFARFGGEEFIIAIANISETNIKAVAERIRQKIANTPLLYNNLNIPLTLSIGVSQYSGADVQDDIKTADAMLYQAKGNGRNQTVFSFN